MFPLWDRLLSHPARGAWIETHCRTTTVPYLESHPARGAWIETQENRLPIATSTVAPREGCVD